MTGWNSGPASGGRGATMDAAVIIVNWNSGDLLSRCLAGIAAQDTRPRRVLVYDNASRDGSVQQARQRFPGVEFMTSFINVGFARANNVCVERCADCEWVCLLNPDAVPAPGCLEELWSAAGARPEFDCLVPLVLQEAHPDRVDAAGDRYLRSGIAVHRFHGRRTSELGAELGAPVEVPFAGAAAALYRRSAFLGAGGFDESYFAYYEDVDLGLRLCLGGARTLLVPAAVVHHRGGGTTGGYGNPTAAYYGQRNFILTYFKNLPAPLLWGGLPAHGWAILKGIGQGILRRRGVMMLRATWDALRMLPDCIRRRPVTPGPRVSAAALRARLSA